MPKYQVASRRNKYGINKNYGLFEKQRKNYDLMTSPKENVLGPPAKDSLFILDEGEFLASDFTNDADSLGLDSLQTDSLAVLPEFLASAPEPEDVGPKYKYRYRPEFPYNHEQEYYNKYFGKLFLDTRPPAEKDQEIDFDLSIPEADSLGVKKKKKLIPGLFKKKKRQKEEEPKSDIEEEVVDPELNQDPEEQEGGN